MDYAHPEDLVSTDWLARHLEDPELRILDATYVIPGTGEPGRDLYKKQHISSAVFFDIDDIANTKSPMNHMMPDPVKFSSKVQNLGIGNGSKIVAYDRVSGGAAAARAWWMFRVFGHSNVAILDGGFGKWVSEGRKTDDLPPRIRDRHFIPRHEPARIRGLDQIKVNIASGQELLLDARSAGRFAGTEPEPRDGMKSGHVPGSRNLPWTDLLDPKTKTLLPADALAQRFAVVGIDHGKPVIASCGSGVTACMLVLGLHLVGRDDVSVYDGSWTEWSLDKEFSGSDGCGMKRDTKLVHAGRRPKDHFGAVNPPVYHVSTVVYDTVGEMRAGEKLPFDGMRYGRFGTPTSFALEDAVRDMEGGYRTISTSSGLAAITGTLTALLKAGDHVLMTNSAYFPARRFCTEQLARYGVETTFYDPLIGGGIAKMMKKNTRVVFVESPGSLTFEVQDIPAIAEAAHAKKALVVMDNTWATPLFFKPFEKGVDVSIQAATKFIVGHSDAMLGTISCATEEIWKTIKSAISQTGVCAGAEECYLGLRGLRTLGVRLKQHQESGIKLAEWLRERPEVTRVVHPALSNDPGHALWRRDFSGAPGLFGFELRPCPPQAVDAFLDRLQHFSLGYSWGGFESLIIPTTGSIVRTATKWQAAGPTLRIHTGLEDPDDLIADLATGFDQLSRSV